MDDQKVNMKIFYYMPFKPLGHTNPSGDLIIGTELHDFIKEKGADIHLVSKFRCRWLYLKPHLWPLLLVELCRVLLRGLREKPDIWLTYHTYYKAPDVLGPLCCRILGIPYVIFQGIYSTKRRKRLKTLPGFYLNRKALMFARCIMTNKRGDRKNLIRLVDAERILYIPPGLHPDLFVSDKLKRTNSRLEWEVGDKPAVLTAAMFRPGVKTAGILKVIESCGKLRDRGYDFLLLIAGDGQQRAVVEEEAKNRLGDKVIFLGRLERKAMSGVYSGADLFAFPGIEESLGMVYLEAQSCGLPVVALSDWGAKETVIHEKTGLLSPFAEEDRYTDNIGYLLEEPDIRARMGRDAAEHVRSHHNLRESYEKVWRKMSQISEERW